MSDFRKNVTESWQDSVNVVLGVWLILSPWILGFAASQAAMWNAVVVGVVIAAAALGALFSFQKWEEWADMAFGVWLVISPWVLGFAATLATATWNFVVVGLLTVALAAWSLRDHMAPAG
jgi:SPW repeat